MRLAISLINRSFLHAYITGVLFVVVNRLFGIEKNIFALVVLIGAIIAEYCEYLKQIHNYPGDWFSVIRDSGITILVLLFLLIISTFSGHLSAEKKLVFFIGSVIFIYALIFFLDSSFKPTKKIHWWPKHVFDVISNLLGPFLVSPVLFKLIF